MINGFYVYQHKTADTGMVFYIGKGTARRGGFERAYTANKRSKFWQSIVKKHGVIVEVLELFPTEEEAFNRERQLISIHGRMIEGGSLCNLTAGGDGHSGFSPSPETRAKLSLAVSGEKHPNWGRKLSQETCRKKSETLKSSPHNLKGKKLPNWWKRKIAATKIGELNPMYGKTGAAHPNSRRVRNKITGASYDSVQIAADHLGFKMKTLYNWLSGHRKNPTELEFA